MSLKGQISIDYYVALIIFIFFVVYFLFQISNLVPEFTGQLEEQRMRAEAWQMSELLINDQGYPANWSSMVPDSVDRIERIGMSDEIRNKTNVLSDAKIAALNTICNNQTLGQQFVRNLTITDLQFSAFLVNKTSGATVVSCQPATPNLRGFSITEKRIVAFSDNSFGELTLQVWRA